MHQMLNKLEPNKAGRRSRKKNSEPRRIQSIEVGFRLVRAIEAADDLLSLTALAEQAKMSPSKAYVYLTSFIHQGLIRQDPESGRYGLGRFAAQLGFTALRQMDVIRLARDELVDLREETGCAAHLSVWGNRGPTLAFKIDGKYQGSMMLRLGHVFSLQNSATGRVFLAYLPRTMTDPILALEKAEGTEDRPMLPWSGKSIRADLVSVRRKGYATSEHAARQGFFGIAVPVFDFSGELIAALTLFGPKHRISSDARRVLRQKLKEAGAHISLMLGGKHTNEPPLRTTRHLEKKKPNGGVTRDASRTAGHRKS
jgi:DNA-binding IclR family transcriptional regulator